MSTIKNVIKKCDPTDQEFEEQKEAIQALELLGNAKAEIFLRDIQASLLTAGEEKSNKTIPVISLVGSKKEIRAFSSSETGNIGKVVNDSLSAFLSAKKETIENGVGNLISSALNNFLGAGEALSDAIEMYYVSIDGLSPVRLDLKAWYHCVTAKSITNRMERVVTIVATKSVIDVTHIDLGTFLFLYQGQFNVDTMSNAQLSAAIDEAAEIYNQFVNLATKKEIISRRRATTPEEDRRSYKQSIGVVSRVKDTE